MLRIFLVLFSSISLVIWGSGCTKDIIEDFHTDTIIGNNKPPDYSGIADYQITSYINKLYIDLLGRAPSSAEINEALTYLDQHQVSSASRDTLISTLQKSDEYYERLYTITSNDFLNGVSKPEIEYEILLIEFIYQLDSISGYTYNLVYYQAALNSLYALLEISDAFKNQSITINQYYHIFLNNYFYDQVNMGSENFVKGSFDDLFLRPPTASELQNGVSMVDNAPSTLFLQAGGNKGDYLNIVTTTGEFYQGIVMKMYLQMLLRKPDSGESAKYTEQLKSSGDFIQFQKTILKTDEYAGF